MVEWGKQGIDCVIKIHIVIYSGYYINNYYYIIE